MRSIRRRHRVAAVAAVLAVAVMIPLGCSSDDQTGAAACPSVTPERLVPKVVRELPHATDAFTEGLVIHDGVLYESDGLDGRSLLRAIDPDTGAELDRVAVDPAVFAEGLAVGADDRLVQLTWKNGRALEWTVRPTIRQVDEFSYDGEGWGLTTLDDGTLVRSDGSNRLTEHDPSDFSVKREVMVRRAGGPADQLNELEWDGKRLWANRWRTDEIVRIDRTCTTVDAVVDASALTTTARARAAAMSPAPEMDVLNGIASIPGTDRFLVTGKFWPVMFEVTFEPA